MIPRHQCHPHLVCFLLGQCSSVWCFPPIPPSLVLITGCKFFALLPFLRVNTWAQVPCPSRLLFTISWRLSSQASVICLHLSWRSLFCVSNAQLTFFLSCKHSRQESWGGAPCTGPYLPSSGFQLMVPPSGRAVLKSSVSPTISDILHMHHPFSSREIQWPLKFPFWMKRQRWGKEFIRDSILVIAPAWSFLPGLSP